MCPICWGMFPFSKQKRGIKETIGYFCLLCSGAAGRLQASGLHKSSPEPKLKYAPLHITQGVEKRLLNAACSCCILSGSGIHRRLQPALVQSPLAVPKMIVCCWGTRDAPTGAMPILLPASMGCSGLHEGALVQVSV